MPRFKISVVLATGPGREEQLARASAAYRRETDELQLIVCEGFSLRQAWESGVSRARSRFVHFAYDVLEPHPGWAEAARACCRLNLIPSPSLWSPRGELDWQADWSPTAESSYPTLSRTQLGRQGLPPFAACDEGLNFTIRCNYAFTLWPD